MRAYLVFHLRLDMSNRPVMLER